VACGVNRLKNPNIEIRNPKQARGTKKQKGKTPPLRLPSWFSAVSDFEFVSGFEIFTRASTTKSGQKGVTRSKDFLPKSFLVDKGRTDPNGTKIRAL
jgi:hypothetical protein